MQSGIRLVVCRFLVVLVGVVGVLASSNVQAGPISVKNHSFESPGVGTDVSNNVVDDWTVEGAEEFGAGVFDGSGGGVLIPPTDGDQAAYIGPFNASANSIHQILEENLAPGLIYTLLVDVGHRGEGVFNGYAIQLLAGGVLLAEDQDSLALTDSQFVTSTVTFEAEDAHPQLGSALEIRLLSSSGVGQVNYDNVRLSSTVIPEPSAIAALAMGSIFFLRQRRETSRN